MDIRKKYFGRNGSIYVARKGLDVIEVIDAIHLGGGKAILAHPGRITNDATTLKKIIFELAEIGIDGLEVVSPHNKRDVESELMKICKTYNLIYTGGTDFHGIESEMLGIENEEISQCIISEFCDF